MTAPYSFRPVTTDDLARLAAWRAEPHVRQWWGDGEPLDAAGLADPRVARWIVAHDGEPFAYLQDYTVHGWADHHFFDLPAGSRGIDQYIGLPWMIGRGHGSAFIRLWVDRLFAAGAPVVATDPDPENGRAIAACEKAGFAIAGPPQDTRWGRILPMHARPLPPAQAPA